MNDSPKANLPNRGASKQIPAINILTQAIVLVFYLFTARSSAAQQPTVFTYQGQLRDGVVNANGTFSLIFKLYEMATGGSQIANAVTNSATVANGLFSVNLDFGAGVFNGNPRWLEITVHSGDVAETLVPRELITATPYALYALNGTVGPQGPQGLTGAKGPQGLSGPQGPSGLPGAQGPQGVKGDPGATGPRGPQGSKGDTGLTGATGPQGLPGLQGPTGLTGAQGPQGVKGDTGLKGASGPQGSIGLTGAAGPQGVKGDVGPAGTNGVASINGLIGAVTLAAGTNVTLVTDGNVLRISTTNPDSKTIEPWTIGIQPDGTYAGALLFSYAGIQRMGLAPINGSGSGMQVFGASGFDSSLTVGGNFNAQGKISAAGGIDTDGALGINLINARGANGSITVNANTFTVNGNIAANGFNNTSDRNLKERIVPIDSRQILELVASLPIFSWSFKSDTATRHIGPMAQDFHAAFHLGVDDKHIATVDEGGVALAAIQGLHEVVQKKDAEIVALRQRLADLEKVVSTLANRK